MYNELLRPKAHRLDKKMFCPFSDDTPSSLQTFKAIFAVLGELLEALLLYLALKTFES